MSQRNYVTDNASSKNWHFFVGRYRSYSLRQSKPSLVVFALFVFRWCFSMLENFLLPSFFIANNINNTNYTLLIIPITLF